MKIERFELSFWSRVHDTHDRLASTVTAGVCREIGERQRMVINGVVVGVEHFDAVVGVKVDVTLKEGSGYFTKELVGLKEHKDLFGCEGEQITETSSTMSRSLMRAWGGGDGIVVGRMRESAVMSEER